MISVTLLKDINLTFTHINISEVPILTVSFLQFYSAEINDKV